VGWGVGVGWRDYEGWKKWWRKRLGWSLWITEIELYIETEFLGKYNDGLSFHTTLGPVLLSTLLVLPGGALLQLHLTHLPPMS